MLTANCVKKNCFGCDKKTTPLFLTDQKGYIFPVINDCANCTNIIYNSVPLSLLSDAKDVRRLQTGGVEFLFTTESTEEMKKVLHAALKAFSSEYDATESIAETMDMAEHTTKGHFRRGVKE